MTAFASPCSTSVTPSSSRTNVRVIAGLRLKSKVHVPNVKHQTPNPKSQIPNCILQFPTLPGRGLKVALCPDTTGKAPPQWGMFRSRSKNSPQEQRDEHREPADC